MKPPEIQTFYDQFGKKQDTQSFYEDPALEDLIAHAHFADAKKIFEFGCGTGRFADRLLAEHLSPSATYLGSDLSPTMVSLAKERLTKYAERAQVLRSEERVNFPLPNNSVDRVLSPMYWTFCQKQTSESSCVRRITYSLLMANYAL